MTDQIKSLADNQASFRELLIVAKYGYKELYAVFENAKNYFAAIKSTYENPTNRAAFRLIAERVDAFGGQLAYMQIVKERLVASVDDYPIKKQHLVTVLEEREQKRRVFDHYTIKVQRIRQQFLHLYNNARFVRNLSKLE